MKKLFIYGLFLAVGGLQAYTWRVYNCTTADITVHLETSLAGVKHKKLNIKAGQSEKWEVKGAQAGACLVSLRATINSGAYIGKRLSWTSVGLCKSADFYVRLPHEYVVNVYASQLLGQDVTKITSAETFSKALGTGTAMLVQTCEKIKNPWWKKYLDDGKIDKEGR